MKRYIAFAITIMLSLSILTPSSAVEPIPPVDDASNVALVAQSSEPHGIREISLEGVISWLKNNPEELQPIKENSSMRHASWIYTSDTSHTFYYYAQELSYSCGAAAIRMGLKGLSNLTLSEKTIREGCGITTDGTSISDMVTI